MILIPLFISVVPSMSVGDPHMISSASFSHFDKGPSFPAVKSTGVDLTAGLPGMKSSTDEKTAGLSRVSSSTDEMVHNGMIILSSISDKKRVALGDIVN